MKRPAVVLLCLSVLFAVLSLAGCGGGGTGSGVPPAYQPNLLIQMYWTPQQVTDAAVFTVHVSYDNGSGNMPAAWWEARYHALAIHTQDVLKPKSEVMTPNGPEYTYQVLQTGKRVDMTAWLYDGPTTASTLLARQDAHYTLWSH